MEHYHNVWLGHHPNRTVDWLRERLKDGFGIHHIDGDHENNAPENLVLLDWTDHRMIHAGKKSKIVVKPKLPPRPTSAHMALGKLCYTGAMQGSNWRALGKRYGITTATARRYAKVYAASESAEWIDGLGEPPRKKAAQRKAKRPRARKPRLSLAERRQVWASIREKRRKAKDAGLMDD